MIKITKGIYTHKDGNVYVDITPADPPVSLSKAKEAELVAKGDEPEKVESATTGKGKKKAAKEEVVEP